jgi:hypothetical protein
MCLHAFNAHLASARDWLVTYKLNRHRGADHNAACLSIAYNLVRDALGYANRMRDPNRAALCMKILNWLRADLARLA